MPPVEPSQDLTIPEALASLREQIRFAMEWARGEDLTFEVQNIEVELQVTATTTVKGEGKVGLWNVLTVGGGVDRAEAAVHRITLVLEPRLAESRGRIHIGDRD